MTDAERFDMICKPTLARIEAGVNKLTEVVVTGNGKPSLVARVTSLEGAEHKTTGQRSRSVRVGPVESNGYALSDVLKVAILVAFLGCIWLFLNDRVDRVNVLKELHATHQAMKTASTGNTP